MYIDKETIVARISKLCQAFNDSQHAYNKFTSLSVLIRYLRRIEKELNEMADKHLDLVIDDVEWDYIINNAEYRNKRENEYLKSVTDRWKKTTKKSTRKRSSTGR